MVFFLLSVEDSFGFLKKNLQKIDGVVDSTPINTAHTAQHSTIMRLAQGPSAVFHFIFVPKKKKLVIWCHMSHLWLSHLPFTTSTSSSSLTLPSTTQEHAAQSVQQEQLRENFVDEKRHQRPVCRDQQQIGGKPRHTTPTGYELKALETKSIETGAYSEDPEELEPKRIEPDKSLQTDLYQLCEIQERFMEEDHPAPVTDEVEEFGKIGDKQPYIQSQMHFDYDSAKALQNQILKMESYEKC